MELQSISKQSLTVSQLVRAQVGSGRIALPVRSNRIYANLKHITGIGGIGNQPAFSLSQLRNLDNLIDRLKMLKGEAMKSVNLENASENDVTQMIEDFRRELYTELHKKNPYMGSLNASGLSLELFA
ncbi:MAG: hypothetical protein PQJ61_06075 [Spirochaetales bacterium]|uniref:Uncharacterized protein n=1 Tax=Candidatus Thalassospirochaeta sargassi TaxID=3119039 RepID=A0AAJ1IBP9_9SPIO|nr:hypothetical protein [Spirochaetales bacterium]